MRIAQMLAILGAAALAACGGGGGGGGALPTTSASSGTGGSTGSSGSTGTSGSSSATALPIDGVMPASSATTFGGVTATTESTATVVGFSTHLLTPAAGQTAVTTSDTFTLSSMISTSSTHRAARASAASFGSGNHALTVDAADASTATVVRELRDRARQTATQLAADALRKPRAAEAQSSFWVRVSPISGGTTSYTSVSATLVASGTHGDIYAMNSLVGAGISTNGAIAAAVAADFDNAYTSDTTHFASDTYADSAVSAYGATPYCDSNGSANGTSGPFYVSSARPAVLVLDESALGSGVGGYYNALDMMPDGSVQCSATARAVGAHSNERPMIYVGWEGDFSSGNIAYETNEDLVRGTAHEFQHLINFAQHGIVGGASEDSYINEGLSMLAQDLAVPAMFPALHNDVLDAMRHAKIYLDAPQHFSLVGFSGIDPSAIDGDGVTSTYNCSGCYGAAYLFQRYLYDRFGGDAYLHAEEVGGTTGLAHIAALASRTNAGILEDFGLALAANGAGGTGATSLPGFPFGQTIAAQLPNYATIAPDTATIGCTSTTALDGVFAFFSAPAKGAAVSLAAAGSAPFAAEIVQQ